MPHGKRCTVQWADISEATTILFISKQVSQCWESLFRTAGCRNGPSQESICRATKHRKIHVKRHGPWAACGKSDNIHFALCASMTLSTSLWLQYTSRNYTNNCTVTSMGWKHCATAAKISRSPLPAKRATAPTAKGRQLLPAATLMWASEKNSCLLCLNYGCLSPGERSFLCTSFGSWLCDKDTDE